MPQSNYICPHCKYAYDSPNHEYGCTKDYLQFAYTPVEPIHDDNYQIPKVDPEENWKEYSEYLERYDGQLDLQKVKELAAHYEWCRQNQAAFLQSDLQHTFAKPNTHASWVAAAIRESFHEEKMYEVEELLDILEGGGFEEDEDLIAAVKNYFDYDEWKNTRER